MKADPESVAIVAHSYGGAVIMGLAKKYPDFFKQKVFAICLTDSVQTSAPENVKDHIQKVEKVAFRNK